MSPTLEIEGLSAGYGKAEVIPRLMLHVNSGELVTVIGPNGAGKTTLLHTIMGIVRPRGGCIRFRGEDVTHVAAEARLGRGMVLVAEGRELFGSMSVIDNLRLGAFQRSLRLDRTIGEELERTFASFPILAERRAQLAGTLSGGEQQMLAIGRALMSKPTLLLLDEPSTGLAPRIVQDIFAVIADLKKQGMTAILVEQNAKLAFSVADRAYVLELGEVVLEGSAQAVRSNERVASAYLGAEPAKAK